MAEKPNILIGVPAYRNEIKKTCTQSLVSLAVTLTRANIDFSFVYADWSDISDVRNMFASVACDDATRSHLLMTDSDMQFRPEAVARMLAANKPVIGCAAPLRSPTSKPKFNVREVRSRPKDGICEVIKVGTGIMLIQRSALLRVKETMPLRTHRNHPFLDTTTEPIFGFFDCIVREDRKLSEDFSFCERWRECGGSIYALIDEKIGHAGQINYIAKASDYLTAMCDERR